MSSDNVELVRALQPSPGTDVTRLIRDESAWPAFVEANGVSFADDFTCAMRTPEGRLGLASEYAGLQGLREPWLDWLSPWVRYRTEIEQLLDADDHVVVFVRDHGVPNDSDSEVSFEGGAVWRCRAGKIVHIDFLGSRAEALRAVGL